MKIGARTFQLPVFIFEEPMKLPIIRCRWIALLVVLTSACIGCQDTGVTNIPVESPVTTTNIFAGTNAGVFLSTNDGASWKPVNTGFGIPPTVWALAVDANVAGGANIFAGTFHRGVFRSTDNGMEWTSVDPGLAITDVRTLVAGPNGAGVTNLFAGTHQGDIFLSTDCGTSWGTLISGFPGNSISSLALSPDGELLLAGTSSSYGDGCIFLSANTGETWTDISYGIIQITYPSYPQVVALAITPVMSGGTNLLAGTNVGTFLSTDNGLSWARPSGLTYVAAKAFATVSSDTGGTSLLAGTTSGVYLSTNNGTSWKAMNTGLPSVWALTASADRSGNTKILAGTAGGVFMSTNGGISWTGLSTGLTDEFGDRCFVYSLAVSQSTQ